MMKKITLLFFVLFAFGFYSCDQQNDVDSLESAELEFEESLLKKPTVKDFESILDDSSINYCGEPVKCEFIAGQNINAGSVTVSNDEDYLYVKVYSKAGFQDVSENIKMWIGLEAPSRRPPSGHFPYKVTETGDTHIFKILLSDLLEWDECGKQYDIIVHGDVLTEEGNSGSGETAYGGCELTGDKPWWAYMTYKTECCEEEEMELGWLYKSPSSKRNTCFSDTQSNIYGISARFNYTENYKYGKTYPVYGNVKENCNIEEIEIIGNLTVTLLDWDKSSARLELHFEAEQGYNVDKYYIYIGWINPVNNLVFDSSLVSEMVEVDITSGSSTDTFDVADWAGNRADAEWYSKVEQYYISAMFEYQSN